SGINWMKGFGFENNENFVKIIQVMSEINNFLTKQVDVLRDMGMEAPLTALLPNSTLVKHLIDSTLSQDTSAALFSALINPDKFLNLILDEQKWKEVVCNSTLLVENFNFPPGTNISLVRNDLCNNTGLLTEILSTWDVESVVQSVTNIVNGNLRQNNTDVWFEIEKMSGQFLINIGYLMNVNMSMNGLHDWISPIISSLESLQNPSMNSIESTCDAMLSYVDNTDFYKTSLEPILYGIMNNMALTKQQMTVQKAFEDIICDLPSLNVSTIAEKLKKANITDFIQSLMNVNTSSSSGRFSCSKMTEMSRNLINMWNESVTYSMEQEQKWTQCLTQGFTSTSDFLRDMTKSFGIAAELLQILRDPSLQLVTSNPDIIPVLDFMLNVYSQQQKVLLKITDLLLYNTSTVNQIEDVFNTVPGLLDSLLESTISLNAEDLINKTSSEIADILCDTNKLNQIIHLPIFAPNSTINEISATLCGPNAKTNADLIKEMISLGTLSLAVTLSGVDFLNSEKELLKLLQEFVFSNGPEALAQSGIRSVVKNPNEFLEFLTKNITLSEEVANALLDGSIYYAALLQYKEKDLPSLVCNASKLASLIEMPPGEISAYNVSHQLCHLNDSTIVKMTEAILNNLDIGNLVENYVTSSLDDFLGSFNMSEVQSAFTKISNATVKLQDATYLFGNTTEELELEFVLKPEALKGASSMSSIQDIACGTGSSSSSGQISDVTGAASTVGTSSSLTPDQEREMKTMPGQFCQDLYKEIIMLDGGSVIWGYLKPLMNEKSFAALADFQSMAKSWSKGTKSISDLMADKSAYDTAKKMLQDGSVNSIASMFGFSIDIADSLSIVDNMDANQIGNISMLAEILSNYSSCIETDRFQGYASEQELQEAARSLHVRNNFLAGIVFDNMNPTSRRKRNAGSNLPDHIIYKIRMDIDNVEHTGRLKERYWRPYPEDNFFTEMRYFRGFIQLQDILERAIIELKTGSSINTSTYLQQFPSQCHIKDSYLDVLSSYLLPIMITIAWLASMAISAKNLVYDRENGQEECLFSTTAFGFAAQYLARFEIQMEGIHWYNIKDSPLKDDDFSFSWACLMMLIDGCIYLVIGWYIRNIKPGKYGVSKPIYFPFTTSYWGCGSCSKSSAENYKTSDRTDILVEEPDDRWIPGISLRGLSKSYGNHKAVKNINCDFYEGHVTVLLGHNGAAKTTTINMISGVLEPSGGSVYVYGKPAGESSGKIGVCNQHNALFDYMTVEEHVEFFANIKSNSAKAKLKLETERLLKDVDLWHVRRERISSLSGGMKRKLCVVLAFAGGSEAVILDEPTSGCRPLWKKGHLESYTKTETKRVIVVPLVGCTILLSTHFLDEADIIGDRIAIMHDGRVLCNGSAMFLKQNLGSGYHLKFNKEDDCDLESVMSVVRSHLPGAQLIDNIGSDVTVSLQLQNQTMADLQQCLSEVENNADKLGIGNYGIYDTTMEEVIDFYKRENAFSSNILTSMEMSGDRNSLSTKNCFPNEPRTKFTLKIDVSFFSVLVTRPDYRKRISSVSLKCQQLQGLLTKRFHHYRRDWRMFLSVIILPLVFVTAGLGFMLIKPDTTAPARILTPPLYGPSSYTFIKPPFQCFKYPDSTFSLSSGNTGEPNCSCIDYKYTCNDAAKQQTIPQMTLETTTHLQNLNNKDIEQYLLQTWEMHKLNRYGGWSLDSDDSSNMMGRIWFNNKGRHALPSFYNAFSNSLLRSILEKKGIPQPETFGITAINHPLMLSGSQLTEETMQVIIYCIAVALAVAIMAMFRHDSYWYRDNLAGVTVLILLYGWATIPLMYSLIKCFKDSTSAYMMLFCGSIFICISTVVVSFLLEFLSSNSDIKRVFDVVKYVFLIFPQYAFTYGFMDIVKMQVTTDILSRFGEDLYESPFSYDMLGWNMVALTIEGFVFFILTLILEINCCRHSRVPSDLENEIYTESEEVNNERKRIQTGYGHTDAIVISNLSKVYKRGRKPFLAVDRLCFGVPGGECFGLLGVNGAGKTTTFRMLIGDLTPSEGSAYIKGSRIAQSKLDIGKELGYCPQEDALDRFLTARELLFCYARLRGLPSNNIEIAVNDLISELNMHFADKAIHTYSGGMKRILSVAIALIGDPPVVLLDEPTTGMDPSTKRLVWKSLLKGIKRGQSIVLSSHSMEECDAICSRLAIMVNGELKCLGTSQLLKQKYGDGYTVTLYTYGLSTIKHDIIEMFNVCFPGSQCTIHHQEVLQVNIPNSKTSVAQIIKVLEDHKERCNIQHYSVSQTTLMNVFLNFARDQSDGIIPESTHSASGSDTDSERYSSDPFVNPAYAYMNPSFNDDEKTKFNSPLIFQRAEFSTKL
ncbi:hypothetical protein FSP39_003578, partial [Pinctada imbricata]